MLEYRANQCPICRKVTERPKDGIPVVIERCKHRATEKEKVFLEDDDEDVFGMDEDDNDGEQDDNQDGENAEQTTRRRKKLVSKYPMTEEQKQEAALYENIYKAP